MALSTSTRSQEGEGLDACSTAKILTSVFSGSGSLMFASLPPSFFILFWIFRKQEQIERHWGGGWIAQQLQKICHKEKPCPQIKCMHSMKCMHPMYAAHKMYAPLKCRKQNTQRKTKGYSTEWIYHYISSFTEISRIWMGKSAKKKHLTINNLSHYLKELLSLNYLVAFR